MATKKQKRERALAKREEYLAELKADGLAAQHREQEFRKAQREEISLIAKEINDRYNAILRSHGVF